MITILGYASIFGGITLAISLLMDVLAVLLTPHIFICYILARAVYARVGGTLGSLWALFRGKRYNVLRNRMDSWEYDLDQLLFGTVLFTLLAFLFPTVLVYYALFAVVSRTWNSFSFSILFWYDAQLRLITLLIQASMETLLAFMNHFPLFALMLRIKDPWRLPGLSTLTALLHPLTWFLLRWSVFFICPFYTEWITIAAYSWGVLQ